MVRMQQLITLLGVLAAVVTLILFVYEAPTLYRRTRQLLRELFHPDIVSGLFGEEADIEVLQGDEYEQRLKEEISKATRSVYHVAIHGYTVDYPPEQQIFESDSVQQRYLLLKPGNLSASNKARRSGIESIRDSPFDPDILTTDDKFEDKFGYYHRKLSSGDWKGVDIKLYETTPWIRCAIIDRDRAGFKIVPSLTDGREATGFWTEDNDVVKRLIDIFDDMWYRDDTVDFEPWYQEWTGVESGDSTADD